MKSLETSRLILRGWAIEDANDVYEYAKSEKVGPMAGWKPHESLAESKKIIEMLLRENETWAIYSKEFNKVIGSVGLHATENEEELMLGYVLSEEFWGNGIVLEASKALIDYAFNTLKIDRISAMHFPCNNQSKRVIQKLGFKYIETKEKVDIIYDGSEMDSVCYLLTKDEFNLD